MILALVYILIVVGLFTLVAVALSRVGSQAGRDIDREIAERARRQQAGDRL